MLSAQPESNIVSVSARRVSFAEDHFDSTIILNIITLNNCFGCIDIPLKNMFVLRKSVLGTFHYLVWKRNKDVGSSCQQFWGSIMVNWMLGFSLSFSFVLDSFYCYLIFVVLYCNWQFICDPQIASSINVRNVGKLIFKVESSRQYLIFDRI